MKTVPLMNGVVTTIKADAEVSSVLGSAIYEEGERDFVAPSLTWTLISEVPEGEVFHGIEIQFDPFVRSRRDLEIVQDRLYELFNREIEWRITSTGGFSSGFSAGFQGRDSMLIRSWFLAARHYRTSQGIWGGPMDFHFTAVRSPYA